MDFLTIARYVSDQQDGETIATVADISLSTIPQNVRRLRDNINRAYTQVKLALGWRNENVETSFTLTTVPNQEWVTIPSNILSVTSIRYEDDPPLRVIPWPEFERFTSETLVVTALGSPDIASIYQRRVYFWPKPDGAYTFNARGLKTLTRLSADTDEPELPEEFHQCIADLALYYEMVYENNPSAGVLAVSENGSFQAQGGQAASFVALFNATRRNMRSHSTEQARMIGVDELRNYNRFRRVIRG